MAGRRLGDTWGVVAWRLGLGWLVGRRYLLLTTSDRTDGVRRVLLPYQFAGGNLYVISASGDEPWFHDLRTTPRATIQAAPGPRSVVAHRIDTPDDVREVYDLYARRDPTRLRSSLSAAGFPEDREAAAAGGGRLHWLVFQPTGSPTPPMQPPDLAWLFPIGVLGAAIWRLIARRR